MNKDPVWYYLHFILLGQRLDTEIKTGNGY